jgi:hypothetical protein
MSQEFCFPHRRGLPESHLGLDGQNKLSQCNLGLRRVNMATLARARSTQTQQLLGEDSPHVKTHNCLIVTEIWSWAPDVA